MFPPITQTVPLLQPRGMSKVTPLKLLIVDDHAALRRTLRHLFDEREVSILEAESGEEALEIFATEHPDWVIMDMRMPGMGGLKATEAIHQLAPQTRVVVISQFTDPEYSELARKAGAVEFVNKEDMAHVVELIRRHSRLQP